MSEVRLVAVDLDGTLLNTRNQVSEEDAQAVREAQAAGIRVVLATSRWHASARRIAEGLGIEGPIISHNGALVRWRDGERELLHHRLDIAVSERLARHLDGLASDAYMTVGNATYLRTARSRDAFRLASRMEVVDSLAERLDGAPTAFLVFGQDAVRTTLERFREHHGRELNLAEGFSDTYPAYLNVVHALADKGAGLAAVCTALGVGLGETLAIGDAGPDIAMIRAAGVGVAMGNAAAHVKDAADVVAPPNDVGGVAWALRKYVIK